MREREETRFKEETSLDICTVQLSPIKLTETLADRALSTAAPTLKRMSSKRRRELARLSTDPTSVETSGHQCTGPCMDCLDATWERPPVVRRTRSNELRVRGVV